MVTIYTSPSCSSCKKVVSWFKEMELPFVEKNIFSSVLKEEELKDILSKTENGTDDIISKRSKIIQEGNVDIESMTLSELIAFIKDNPSVLKRPIILSDRIVQVGYNEEEITTFIPQAKRLAMWACQECPLANECEHPNIEDK